MAKDNQEKFRVAIIGAGTATVSLAKIFSDDPEIKIVGVSCEDENTAGMTWAKNMGIFTSCDYTELLKKTDLNIVVDATENQGVEKYLRSIGRTDVEIVKGMSVKMLWRLVEEREDREREAQISLVEQKLLNDIGVMLSNMEKSEQALKLIVESAIDLLEMSAGSVALFDEEKGVMTMEVAIGFKNKEEGATQWKLRPGGLTGFILSNQGPTVIENLDKETNFNTDHLKAQGFKSLIAVPLRAERKIVGILYVDDYKPRKFASHDINQMSLLGTMAAAAIEKLLMLERAEEMAIKDELTKIYNHRYFVRSMDSEMKRTERYKEKLSFCMIDVDHFKHFNDTHGHLMGNEVLVRVASILTETVRDTDIVARYGGEEFAVILPKTPKEMAKNFAERLRHAVETYDFPGGEKQPNGRLTISVGLASYPEDGSPANDVVALIEFADQALYKAKLEGRNRVCVYTRPD